VRGEALAPPADIWSVQSTPEAPSTPTKFYLPSILSGSGLGDVFPTSAWTGDAGGLRDAYLAGESIRYVTNGVNLESNPGLIYLRWTHTDACGSSVIYTDTVSVNPGNWEHIFSSTVPDCQGVTTNTVEVTDRFKIMNLTTNYVVFPSSAVVVDQRQAFDKCALPTVEQMATWWANSPYKVHNLYLGGISFACPSNPLNPYWLQAVAGQGWSFILTWVGPQAPCSNYAYRMSSNATTAYQQGRAEAAAAAAAARKLGFLAGKVIYYDMESYSGASASCRATVAAFMRGWTERLHELGALAGGYGSPCTSYISDWATNNPSPDDIWIAHWILPYEYNPTATVWSTACSLNTSLWSNHQRLRQYTGGHWETWGSLALIVDSSVLDGAVTALPVSGAAALVRPALSLAQAATAERAPAIRQAGLLSPGVGWALVGESLLWTWDGGGEWVEITPASEPSADLLAVRFLDERDGWLVRRTPEADGWGTLELLRTGDGGASWQVYRLPLDTGWDSVPVESASFDLVDASRGRLYLKLQSGSSFNLWRVITTADGGQTWVEQPAPPDGFSFPEELKQDFVAGGAGWAVVQQGTCGGYKAPAGQAEPPGVEPWRCVSVSRLMQTADGGETWVEVKLPGAGG